MDSSNSILFWSICVAYAFLLHFKCPHAQGITSPCDVNQTCSCCSINDTCLSNETSRRGLCSAPCSIGKCTDGCSNGYCLIPCKDGYWGQKCINKCPDNCISCRQFYRKTNECFKCVVGKYGKNCTADCPENCSDRTCEKTTGSCLKCSPGYHGEKCSYRCTSSCMICDKLSGNCESCKDGYYGAKCSACPSNCATNSCFQENGTCSDGCKHNFHGQLCDSCMPGKYGENCSNTCSPGCKDDVCERENGKCTNGCKNGFSNKDNDFESCRHCNYGFYTETCSERCPMQCQLTCNRLFGECDNCKSGFFGNKCEKECPSNCAQTDCFQNNGTCSMGCIPGRYGKDCLKTCSPGCKNDICDKEQGHCLNGCKNDFSDSKFCCANNPYCTECASNGTCNTCMNNTYGSQCEFRCPAMCNGICHILTGNCTSCMLGYYGDDCSMRCNESCRNGVCDIDGQCTSRCINNSAENDCTEDQTTRTSVKGFPFALVVGTVVSIVVLLLILVLILGFRQRYQARSNNVKSLAEEERGVQIEDVVGNDVNVDIDNPSDDASENFQELHEHTQPITNPYNNERRNVIFKTHVRLDRIQELISKHDEAYENEFQRLPRGLIKPHQDACKPENMHKNRYNAIYPYDENRVKVVYGNLDYINASYINGFRKSSAYIAALGPTKKTISNFAVFWKMVWQEKVEVIVMLTRLVESSGMKCDQYWPDYGTVEKYGDITIRCDCEDVYAEFTSRQFTMTVKKQRRQLHHLQFTAWPDKGVPDDIISIINLRQRIDRIGCRFDGPLLVHCSAGIGRTGTYIALDILSKQGAAENAVDVFKCVLNLRHQRVNMVQMLDQYKFLHYAVAWTFMVDIEQLPMSAFQELSWIDRQLSDMYEILQLDMFKETDEDTDVVVSNMEHTYANREHSDIPDNRHVVKLWPQGQAAAEATGYINAVYIDGFRRRNKFIAAQTPLSDTVSDFLKMIIQCEPCCIIDLESGAENKLDVGEYLPAANQTLNEGSHLFRVIGREKQNGFTKRTLEVSANSQPCSVTRTIEHFTFTKWPNRSTVPEDTMTIVDFILDIETTLSKTDQDGPILVHCLNGAARSGLLCGVWLAIERLEHEQRVNVMNTLRQVKYRRRQAIVNKEQLQFCFECISTYANRLESNVYSNQ